MSEKVKRNPSFRDVMGYLEINRKTHCLYKGLNTIGRNRTATVIIKHEKVSKEHAIITIVDEKTCYVSDFQSFNGTFLDKKKLQPLRLYQISYDTKIAFAEVVGIYRKVPADQSTGDHCYNIGVQNAQNTQSLSESFYAANTQVLENTTSDRTSTGIGDTSYFDDDYNFADMPSPSFHNNDENQNTSDKASSDINNMSTQTYCSDASDVGDCQIEAKTSAKTIHDLPTQIICHEVALDICVGDSQNTTANETVDSNNSPLIHKTINDVPTQLITKGHVNMSCSSSTKDGSKQEHSIHSQPTQITGSNDEKLEHAICDDSCMLNNDKSLIDASVNVIEETILDDSGVDITSSLHASGKSQPSIVQAISSLDSDSQSNLHVNQLNRRTLKPIADDEEEVLESQESDIINSKLKKKTKPILQSSSDDSDSEVGKLMGKSCTKSSNKESSGSETEIENSKPISNKTKLKLKHKKGQNEDADSDSSTEIEDLDVVKNSKPKNNKTKLKLKRKKGQTEIANSGSSTEIEDLDVAANENGNKRRRKPRKSIIKSSSDSDTDIENVTKVKRSQSPATTSNKGVVPPVTDVKKCNNLEILNDSDIIPATQISDNDEGDDEDDFNFAPEIYSTLVNKVNKDNTQESIDMSQKLEDLRRRTVIPQECSEESIHLALTEGDDDSFKNTKENNEDAVDDDDKTPDISDDDTTTKPKADKNSADINNSSVAEKILSDVNRPTASRVDVADEEEGDDIFAKATQKIAIQDDDKNKPQNVFEIATQDLAEELVEKNDVFVKPLVRSLNDRKSTKNKKSEIAVKDEGDIFLQSTQVLPLTEHPDEDNIFMQPTQRIASNTEPNIPADEDDIFMQPTQPVLPNKIMEPIQKITPNQSNKSNDQAEDDVFMQPTQIITLNEKDDAIEKDPPKDDDLFMQPTQIIEVNDTSASQKPSLSVKQTSSKDKQQEIESQLEVMFATQTLQLPPEINSRPSNPLINVFEGKQDVDSQQASERLVENECEQEDYVEKSPSSDSTSLKEYCTRATLPIDELEDLQKIPHCSNEKDKNTKTFKRTLRNKPNDEDESVAVEPRTSARRPGVERNLIKQKVDSSDNATIRKSKRTSKASVEKEDVRLEKTAMQHEADPSDNTTVRKSKRTAKIALGKEDKLMKQEPSTGTSTSKSENKELKRMTHEVVEDNTSDIKRLGRRITKQNVKPENILKVVVTHPSVSDNDDSFDQQKDNLKTKVKDKVIPVVAEKKNVRDKKKASPIAIKDNDDDNISANTSKKDLRTSRSSRSRKGIEKIEEENTAIKSNIKPIVIDSSDDDQPDSTNTSKNNMVTSRTTRNRSNEKKVHSLVVKPDVTSQNRRTKSKQNAVQEDKTDSEASASTDFSNIPVATPSRKSKRTMNNDSTAVTSGKRKKNTESTSESVPLRTASARKSKRVLSTESEKDMISTPSKKKKTIESSSENEEINLTTTRRNKQLQLNTTLGTPDRNRRKAKPKVVFTMLDSPELESVIRSLGGMVVDSVDACTVLVTSSLKRSQKLLSAVGQGKPICSSKWLQDSKKASTFLDPWDFILQDDEAERKWNFSLRESLNRSLNKKLLADFTVHLAVSVAGDVLKAAVESCGGKCVAKAPAKNTETNFIVVANPDNKAKYSRFLKQKPPVTVVAPEAIFDGVLRQELHLEDHMLSL